MLSQRLEVACRTHCGIWLLLLYVIRLWKTHFPTELGNWSRYCATSGGDFSVVVNTDCHASFWSCSGYMGVFVLLSNTTPRFLADADGFLSWPRIRHGKLFENLSFSAGTDFSLLRRQNLTSKVVRFWHLKSVLVKHYNGRSHGRHIT